MDPIFLFTGLASMVGALGGLFLVCRLERRALTRRRNKAGKTSAAFPGQSEPAASTGE